MEGSTLLLALIYFVCYPLSIASMEFAIAAGGRRFYCRSIQTVTTILAAASAAGLHHFGKL